MPGMDAFAVMHYLGVRLVTTPVILMSAHVTHALRRRAADAGVRHVLEKPLFNGGLLDALYDILGTQPWPLNPAC
jgi:CheY-like chemotaxis protein